MTHMLSRSLLRHTVLAAVSLAIVLPSASAQSDTTRRGRKYKVPPPTSHLEVEVLRDSSKKPVQNAAVILRATKDGRDEGNIEVKTDENGKAIIDVILTGSKVDVQVIADGFATYAENYVIAEPTRAIQVNLVRPRAQISTYVENHGKSSERAVGVQEPNRPTTPPVVQAPKPTNHISDPNPLTPVDPNATPATTQNPTTPPKP